MFKIKKEGTDLYSIGGQYPKFTKTGKVWANRGALKLHLRQFIVDRPHSKEWENKIPRDWVVIYMQPMELSEGQTVYVENKCPAYTFYPLKNPYRDYRTEEFKRNNPRTLKNYDDDLANLIANLPLSEEQKIVFVNKLDKFIKAIYFFPTKK